MGDMDIASMMAGAGGAIGGGMGGGQNMDMASLMA